MSIVRINNNIQRRGNILSIKFNGFSTPFGGVSWEYTEDKKQKEYEAIQLLFIFLEGKRLINLPFSRNGGIPFNKDMKWCLLSAINLKDNIFVILVKYNTLPSDVKKELQSIIDYCNILIEGIASLDSSVIILNNDSQKYNDFLNLINNFKQSIFPHIVPLSQKYSIEFKEIEFKEVDK